MSPNIDNPAYLLTLLTGGLTNGALYALVALAIAMASHTFTPRRVSSKTANAPSVAISPWARLMWLVVL